MDKINCECGNTLSYTVGDTVQSGVYRWYLSSHCNKCGSTTELDGCGIEDIPTVVQQTIIEKYGEWEVLAKSQISKINYLMKKLLEIYETDIVTKNTLTVYRGTKNQALWIKSQLIQKGISESAIEIKAKL